MINKWYNISNKLQFWKIASIWSMWHCVVGMRMAFRDRCLFSSTITLENWMKSATLERSMKCIYFVHTNSNTFERNDELGHRLARFSTQWDINCALRTHEQRTAGRRKILTGDNFLRTSQHKTRGNLWILLKFGPN